MGGGAVAEASEATNANQCYIQMKRENDFPNEENGSQNEDIDRGWVLTSTF